MDRNYLVFALRAKQEKAEIHWGDEAGIQKGSKRVSGFASRGETPAVRWFAKQCSISKISTIVNSGKVRCMMYRDGMHPKLLFEFITRLMEDGGGKVFLILDNLHAHHGNEVKQGLKLHREQIAVFHLPSYSPERHPDE